MVIRRKPIERQLMIRIIRNFLASIGCASVLAACSLAATPARSADAAAANHRAASANKMIADSLLILPGAFSEQTTLTDFQSLFGKLNVRVIESAGIDTATERSLLLFPDDPARRAQVHFHDSAALKSVAEISVSDPGSRWRGKQGVRIGMSLAELRKINGKQFFLSGFDDGRQGAVRDQWSPALEESDAGLGRLDVEDGEQMYFAVELGMRANPGDVPASVFPVDDSVSSDDPRFSRFGEIIRVTSFSAYTSLDDEW